MLLLLTLTLFPFVFIGSLVFWSFLKDYRERRRIEEEEAELRWKKQIERLKSKLRRAKWILENGGTIDPELDLDPDLDEEYHLRKILKQERKRWEQELERARRERERRRREREQRVRDMHS